MLTLIEARPGAGKTTTLQRLAKLLERDMTLTGFVTEEIREGGRRVGFAMRTLGGESGVLAHHKLPGPPAWDAMESTSASSSGSRSRRFGCRPTRS